MLIALLNHHHHFFVSRFLYADPIATVPINTNLCLFVLESAFDFEPYLNASLSPTKLLNI